MKNFEKMQKDLPKVVRERLEDRQAMLAYLNEGITAGYPAAIDIRDEAREVYPDNESKMKDLAVAIIYISSFIDVLKDPADLLLVCDGAEIKWDVSVPLKLRGHLIEQFVKHCQCGCA